MAHQTVQDGEFFGIVRTVRFTSKCHQIRIEPHQKRREISLEWQRFRWLFQKACQLYKDWKNSRVKRVEVKKVRERGRQGRNTNESPNKQRQIHEFRQAY